MLISNMTHNEGFCWWNLNHLHTDELIPCLSIQDFRGIITGKEDSLNYLIDSLYHKEIEDYYQRNKHREESLREL